MKAEPAEVSVDDALAEPNATVPWTGVRNYQARNFMRDSMQVGDGVLFYHASCAEPGIVGLARVASAPYPDPTQFDPASPYFDPKADPASPRWLLVDVQVLHKTRNLTLPEMRADPLLAEMLLLKRGNRLSITPVEPAHWRHITEKLSQGSNVAR
jgi:predicted RNA-binding protein with PUA-like domain